MTSLQTSDKQLIDLITKSFAELTKTLTENTTDLHTLQEQFNELSHNLTLGTGLPIFRGGSDQPLQFIQKFSSYADFYNWADEKSRHAFSLCLQGEPSWWYLSLDHDNIHSMTDLLKLFRGRFLAETDNFRLRQQLNQRKQLPGETVEQYASHIKRRCVRLDLSASETLHCFIQGLRPDLQEFTILKKPETFEQAVSSASLKASLPTHQS